MTQCQGASQPIVESPVAAERDRFERTPAGALAQVGYGTGADANGAQQRPPALGPTRAWTSVPLGGVLGAAAPRRRRAAGPPGRRGCRAPARRSRCPGAAAGFDRRAQLVDAPPVRADTNSASGASARSRSRVSGSAASTLLNTSCSGTPSASMSAEHLAHGADLRLGVGVGGVDDVQDQVGLGDLLQRRAERLDELGRQVADEARRCRRACTRARRRSRHRRTVGSRVANSAFSTSTPASVSRLSSEDLPALV